MSKKTVTAQELFNLGWQAFVVEGRPWSIWYEAEGTCGYRGEDGAACLIGLVIDDEDYTEALEETEALDVFDTLGYEYDPGVGRCLLLSEMQAELHDELYHRELEPGSEDVRLEYINFAERYNLEVPKGKGET